VKGGLWPALFLCYRAARMEIPSKISIFNRTLEIKGKPGTLIAINDYGFYEVVLEVQSRNHTVLFPIAETVLIFNDALPSISADFEVER
jgi:hypothetical protein